LLRNLLFNLTGRVVPIVIAVVCIPIYLRYVGVSGYGIVGIYQSIAILAGVFDFAFSNTINRELARRRAPADGFADDTGAVFRTLELFAWGVAAALAVALMLAAPYLVNGWIGREKFPDHDIVRCVQLIGWLLLLQAPVGFYGGCLYGLHRHGLLNALTVAGSILSAALAIGALVFVSAKVETFLVAQFIGRAILLAALATAAYRVLLREAVHRQFKASLATFKRLWRFAVSMNGVGLLTLLSSQADMLVLTRVLPGDALGYYTVARTLAQGFFALAMPMYQTAFPQLTKMVASKDIGSVIRTFHRYCQLLAILLIPAGLVTIAYSEELLVLWTRDPALADGAALTLSLLVAGSVLSGLNSMMSAVQMAYGAVRVVLRVGLCFVGLIFPTLVLLANLYAGQGAAFGLLLVNIITILLSAGITLTSLLKGQFTSWLVRDTLVPIAGAIAAVVVVELAVPGPPGSPAAIVSLFLSAVVSLIVTAGLLPAVRGGIVEGSVKAWKLVPQDLWARGRNGGPS
jgi:O-antigen/teichoic acid export membrane protein